MELILLEKIKKLGNLGETVKVKPGFGRNYLLPQGKAVTASKANIEYFEQKRSELEKKAKDILADAEAKAKKLEGLEIEIAARASEEGKLFGSIGAKELATEIAAKGIEVARQEIMLPEGPFRTIGNYEVELHLHHGDVVATIKLSIVNE